MHINLWETLKKKRRIYTRYKCPICRKGKKKKKMNQMKHIMKNVRREVYFANCSFTLHKDASLFDTCIIWRMDHMSVSEEILPKRFDGG